MTVSARKLSLLFLAAVAALLTARSAAAATNPTMCANDIDCVATPQCGGDVCDYNTIPPMCKPAGSAAKGSDGWCTTDTDCKCHGEGATCPNHIFCTFTLPCDAPDAGPCGAGGSGGGTSGSDGGGGSGGGGGGGGCNVAGSDAAIGWAALLGVAGLIAARRRRR